MPTSTATRMIQASLLNDQNELPLVVEPSENGFDPSAVWLADWASEHQSWIDDTLRQHGAMLFRGFPLETERDFKLFFQAVSTGTLCDYVAGNSPRDRVSEGVYTSTSYPAQYEIPLHNEMSYANRWPRRIGFFCKTAPQVGGETTLGDSRQILQRLPTEMRERFRLKKVKYVQHLHGGWGLGKSWQDSFGTDDRTAVEAFCRGADIDCHWRPNGALDTSQVRDAILKHPTTGQDVWFNQVDQWHPTAHSPEQLKSLRKFMAEDELPHNAFWEDGSPMDAADLDAIRDVYRQVEVLFSWQQGDVLLLDNIRVAHGRKPFAGPRKILVAMS